MTLAIIQMSQILSFYTDEEGFSFHTDTISFIQIC